MTKEERLKRVKAAKEARKSASTGGGGSTSNGPVNKDLPLFAECVLLALQTGGIPTEIERMSKENFIFGKKPENYTRDYVGAFHKNGLKKTHSNTISIMVNMMTEFYARWSDGFDPAIIGGAGVMVLGEPSVLDEMMGEPKAELEPKPKPKAKKK